MSLPPEPRGPAGSAGDPARDQTPTSSRIVVGVDGSPASLAAARWAADQAVRTHASLDLVAVWEWTTGYGWSVVPPEWDPPGDSRRQLEHLAATLATTHPDVAFTTTVVEGSAGPVLVAAALDADLLVVGSRGRGPLRGAVLGSVSLHCVTHAPCPVTVVPPPVGPGSGGGDGG